MRKTVQNAVLGCVLVCFAVLPAFSQDAEARMLLQNAAAAEAEAAQVIAGGIVHWDTEKFRELMQTIGAMPEALAAETVWLLMHTPGRMDSVPVLNAAMSSPHPKVRSLAADALLAVGRRDARELLLARLMRESDTEVVNHILNGIASTKDAVRMLIDVMFQARLPESIAEPAAGHLRRLTRADLPSKPQDWVDWWLDNEQFYE